VVWTASVFVRVFRAGEDVGVHEEGEDEDDDDEIDRGVAHVVSGVFLLRIIG